MTKGAGGIAGVVLCVAAVAAIWAFKPQVMGEGELATLLPKDFAPDLERGELLYHLGGCGDCHASSEFGGLPAGGMPLETAYGTFFAPNITPDAETGIGNWTSADFVNAMHQGVSPEGKHYYPAFPYTAYARVTREDLLHLKAFLNSLPPVNRISSHQDISFPFNFRFALAFWKLVGHRAKIFTPDPERSFTWNQGAYLVNGLGHCGVCHTPRNIFLAESRSMHLQGAPPLKDGEPRAPRIAGIDPDTTLNALSEWSGSIDEDSSMFLVTLAYSNHVPLELHDSVAEYLHSLAFE